MTERVRQYRGISKRLAAQYLQNLGGEVVAVENNRIEGDRWAAELSAETVNPVGAIELSEVTVAFEGNPRRSKN